MSKRSLVNVIGKLFVDESFRKKYFADSSTAQKKLTGLTTKEKNFLNNMGNDIRRCVNTLDIKYKGEQKRK
jgi:hypothetical protein